MNSKQNNYDDPIINNCSENVYNPSDDTYLIIDHIKNAVTSISFDGFNIKKIDYILDMGTGTGIIAIFLKLLGTQLVNFNPKIFASDILKEAIECAKKNEKLNNKTTGKIHYIHSNLFKSFPKKLKNKFNVIFFNPPYLPSIKELEVQSFDERDYAWRGGEIGNEILLDFFDEIHSFLNKENNAINLIYFITSSRVKNDTTTAKLMHLGFQTEELVKSHFFFEDIILNRAVRISH